MTSQPNLDAEALMMLTNPLLPGDADNMLNLSTQLNGDLHNSAASDGCRDSPPAEVPNSIDLLVNKNKTTSRFPVFNATPSSRFPRLFMHPNEQNDERNDENDVQTAIFDLRNRLIEQNSIAPQATFEFVVEKFPHERIDYKNLRSFPLAKKTRNEVSKIPMEVGPLHYQKFPLKSHTRRNMSQFPMSKDICYFSLDATKIHLIGAEVYSKLTRLRHFGFISTEVFSHRTFPTKRINHKQPRGFPNNMLYEIFPSTKNACKFPLDYKRKGDLKFPVAHTPRSPECHSLRPAKIRRVMDFTSNIQKPLKSPITKSVGTKSFPVRKIGKFQKFPVRHETNSVLTKHLCGLRSNISNNDGVPLTHFKARPDTELRTDITTNTQVAPSGRSSGGADHQRSPQQVEAALKFLNDALLSAINSINTGQQRHGSNQIEQANLLLFAQNINDEQDEPPQPTRTTIPTENHDAPRKEKDQNAHNSVCNHRLAQSQPCSDVRGTSSQAVRPEAATRQTRGIPPRLSEIALASLTGTVESRIRSHLELLPNYYEEAKRSAADEWTAVINTADSHFDSTGPAINETHFSTREALEMTIARVEDSETDQEYLSDSNQPKSIDDTPTSCADEMKFEMKSVKGALPSIHDRTASSTNVPLKMDSTAARWSTSLAAQNEPTHNTRWSASHTPQTYRRSSTAGLDLQPVATTHVASSYRPAVVEQRLQRPELSAISRTVSADTLETVLPTRTRLRRQRRMLSQQKSEEQPEDAIERLNRLRARISGALSEVKGVLQQYSADVEGEGDAEQFPQSARKLATPRSTASGVQPTPPSKEEPAPVQFRFVRKVRRRSIFDEEEENQLKIAEREAERRNEVKQVEGKSEATEIEAKHKNEAGQAGQHENEAKKAGDDKEAVKNEASEAKEVNEEVKQAASAKKTEPCLVDATEVGAKKVGHEARTVEATKIGDKQLQVQKIGSSLAEIVEVEHKNEAKQAGDERHAAKQVQQPKNEAKQAGQEKDAAKQVQQHSHEAKQAGDEKQTARQVQQHKTEVKQAGHEKDATKQVQQQNNEAEMTESRMPAKIEAKMEEIPDDSNSEQKRDRTVGRNTATAKSLATVHEEAAAAGQEKAESPTKTAVSSRRRSMEISKKPREPSAEASNNLKQSAAEAVESAVSLKEPYVETATNQNKSSPEKVETSVKPRRRSVDIPKIPTDEILKDQSAGNLSYTKNLSTEATVSPKELSPASISENNQKEPSEATGTSNQKPAAPKVKKRLVVKVKDPARRASIAVVEQSKIEPPLKTLTVQSIKWQRRPSDSEAVLKKKPVRIDEAEPAAISPKIKVMTKVRRTSLKGKLNEAQEQASDAQQPSDTNNSVKDALPKAAMTVVSTTPAPAVPVPTQSVIDDAPSRTAASTCEATKDSGAATKPHEQSATAMVATLVSTVRSSEQNGLTTSDLLRKDNQAAAGEIQKNTIPLASAEVKKPINQEISAPDTHVNKQAARTPQQVAAPEAKAPSGGAATKANIAPLAADSSGTPAASETSVPTQAEIGQAPPQPTMPELQVAHLPVQPVPNSLGAPFNVPKEDFGKKKVIIKKIIRKISIDRAKKSEDKTTPDETDKSQVIVSDEQDIIPTTEPIEEIVVAPVKKTRKVKRKVIIKRQQRRLSISDTFFNGPDDSAEQPSAEVETLEKAIAYETDEEAEEELKRAEEAEPPEPPKPLKSCLHKREYEIGDWVMYAERYKKTQVRWKKGRVVERITSISYKLDIDGKEVPAHISYIKKFTERKVSFSGKEYLEIDYEQIAQEEQQARSYSIWNMV